MGFSGKMAPRDIAFVKCGLVYTNKTEYGIFRQNDEKTTDDWIFFKKCLIKK